MANAREVYGGKETGLGTGHETSLVTLRQTNQLHLAHARDSVWAEMRNNRLAFLVHMAHSSRTVHRETQHQSAGVGRLERMQPCPEKRLLCR